MMTDRPALMVVKIGGSLMGQQPLLDRLMARIAASKARVVILPGGGAIADGIRQAQREAGFSDRLAHDFAIDAMTKFGEILCEFYPQCRTVGTLAEAESC